MEIGEYDPTAPYYDVGSVTATLTMGTWSGSWSHTFDQTTLSNSVIWITPTWNPSLSGGSYAVSLTVTMTDYSSAWSGAPSGLQTSSSITGTGYNENVVGQTAVSFDSYYQFNGQSSGTYTPSLPSDTSSYQIKWTAQDSSNLNVGGTNVQSGTAGTWTENSGTAYTEKLTAGSFITSFFSYTGTLQVISIQVNSPVSQSYNSGPLAQTITQNINWWNASTVSKTVSLPSGWNSGASFSGSINHILSVGYGTGAKTDNLNIGGTASGNFDPPTSKYNSVSVSGTVNSGGLTVKANTSEYITYLIGTTLSPPSYSSISQTSVPITLSYSSPIALQSAELYINNQLADRYTTGLSTSGSLNYTYSDPSLSPLTGYFTLSTGEYSQTVSFTYGGATSVPENSSSIIVLQSPNATHSYPITLSGVPSGSGYYQQLVSITNPSQYGINSAGSNVQFASPNGTLLYAWEQSVNSSAIQVWIKNFNGSSQISMQVFPSFENLLSANGYLGLANSSKDNGNLTFSGGNAYYANLWGTSSSNIYYQPSPPVNVTQDNGLIFSNASSLYNVYLNKVLTGDVISYINIVRYSGDLAVALVYQNQVTHAQSYISPTGTGIYNLSNQSSDSTLRLVVNGNGVGYERIAWWFVVPEIAMPTASISGSGSAFMANSTTTSSFTGNPGKEYNATYQYDSYPIPIAPTTSYLTVLYDGSWTIANLYPSTYTVFAKNDMVLFNNLTGFTSIQVTFIQPSVLIGTSVSVSLLMSQQGTNETIGAQYSQEFSPIVTYTPFGSTASVTFQPNNFYFSLPYGATATVQIKDYWQEYVGSAKFSVTSSSVQVDVPLNVSYVSFLSSSTGLPLGSLSIRSGTYNLSGINPVYLQNGSSYEWYTSNINGTGLVSGTIKPDEAIETDSINIGAPASNLIVNVQAYSGSDIGTIQNGGPASGIPTVYLYINGVNTPLDSSFIGTLGSTYNITIKDVFGHTLFQKNLKLSSPIMPETFNITTPSYIIGFTNKETGTANVTTQYNDMKVVGTSGPWVNFTTAKNLESEIYVAANYTYYLHTHDQVTTTITIPVTNSSIFYAFNNTDLYTTTEEAFNNSIRALDVSVNIPTLTANTAGTTIISLYQTTVSGRTPLTEAQTKEAIANMTVQVLLNGTYDKSYLPVYVSPGKVSIDLNLSAANAYTLNVTTNLVIDGKALSWSSLTGFSVTTPPSNTLLIVISEILGVISSLLTIYYVGRILYRKARAKEIAENGDDEQIANNIRSKLLAHEPVTDTEMAFLLMSKKQRRMWLVKEQERLNRLNKSGKMRKFLQSLKSGESTGSGKK